MKNLTKYTILICVIFIVASCKTYNFRTNYENENALLHSADSIKTKLFLKAHLKNGDICIFKDSWQVDTLNNLITGSGVLYDFNRKIINLNQTSIPIDSIALYETNKKLVNPEEGRIAALAILTSLDAILGIICITVPKACFGSCPTFYTEQNSNKNIHFADAEGFSSSILPSLEKSDIDAINQHYSTSEDFSITMKNEALETHCIDEVKLLVYPLSESERVFESNTEVAYLCKNITLPTSATAEEGNIISLINQSDKDERFSLADSNNLSSKEEITLTFENVNSQKDLGILLDFRQTLMSTFLFYNTMSYMGDLASDIFAQIDTNDKLKQKLECMNNELGGIDVLVYNEATNEWEFQGTYNELGPIAVNSQLLPLKNKTSANKLKVKLILNKGTWRIDRISLTEIVKQVNLLEINPNSISLNNKVNSNALMLNSEPNKYIVSMPGNVFTFNFQLPEPNKKYEMFIYSKGYYLEWMRNDWIKDKDIVRLKKMYVNPKNYLKKQAKFYKSYEKEMEEIFWNSKVTTNQFSYEK